MHALDGANRVSAWLAIRSAAQAQWEELSEALLALLYPPHCGGCGQAGTLWCSACHAQVQPIQEPTCPRCGRPQPEAGLCPRCSQVPLQIECIRSAAAFEGPLRQAIHQLKYKGRTSLARPLGQYMNLAWQARPLPADLVVPVPLHPARLRERGYNQAALLAERLARGTGLGLDEKGLQRVRATSPQVDLNAAERKANVHGAFRAEASRVRGLKIIVVDDVCTTGATLEACGLALREAGAQCVYAMTLARA